MLVPLLLNPDGSDMQDTATVYKPLEVEQELPQGSPVAADSKPSSSSSCHRNLRELH